MLDLDLLVEPTGRLGRTTLTRDQQLSATDLERHVLDVDPGEIRLDDRPRRIVRVVDVNRGREAAPAQTRLALEDVAEQRVDLAPHALEVGEQVPRGRHSAEDTGAPDSGGGCRAGPAPRLRLRRRRPRGRPRRGRRSSRRPRRARGSRRARPRCAPGRSLRARGARRGPASAGVRWPRMPVRSGRGKVASTSISSTPTAKSARASVGLQSAPYTMPPPPFAELMHYGERLHEMGNGTEADANRADLELARRAELLQPKGLLDQVVVAPGPDHPAERVPRPGGACSSGRAGSSVPGQRSTGTGCCRGA